MDHSLYGAVAILLVEAKSETELESSRLDISKAVFGHAGWLLFLSPNAAINELLV